MNQWKKDRIGNHILPTKTRNPQRFPESQFTYIDVSSVDNILFKITNPSLIYGRDASSRARKIVQKDDVIFATVRPTLRRIAYITENFHNQICSTGYCVLKVKESLDSKFLYYWLLSDFILREVEKIQRGASYPAIRDSDLKNLQIPLPPIEEQRKIAMVLSLVQDAIAQQEQLITLTTELKKSLMHKLFTEGTRGEPQRNTEIGLIPESWDVARIDTHCDSCVFGPRFSSKEYQLGGEIVTLRTTDMDNDGNIDYTNAPRATLNRERFSNHFLKIDDIVISRSGTCGISSVFTGYHNPVLPGAFLIRLRVKDSVFPQFIRHYINSPVGRSRILQLAEGAIQKNISGTRLKNFIIPVSHIEEQKNIANNIDLVQKNILLHKQKYQILQNLFRTLLHQLMTAQIRVDDLNISADNFKTQGGNE